MSIRSRICSYAALAALGVAGSSASALPLYCNSGNSAASCAAAVGGITWDLVGSLLTFSNVVAGSHVSEFYFDSSSGMSVALASFSGVVSLTGGSAPNGSNPGNLPSGNAASPSFTADFSWDSGPGSTNGMNAGESVTFLLSGVTLSDFQSGAFRAGLHVRSLVGGESEGLITTVGAIPEPETYALMLAGLGVMGVVARRRRAQR